MKEKIIKPTISLINTDVFINSKMIGHFYRVEEKRIEGRLHAERGAYTKVAVLTHNNGVREVLETPEQMIELLTKNK